MQYPYLFNYNIPAENHKHGWPDQYLSIFATCNVGNDGKASAVCRLVDTTIWQVGQVTDWKKAANEIEQIAQQHFQRLVDLDRRLQAEDTLRQINWVEGQDKIAS